MATSWLLLIGLSFACSGFSRRLQSFVSEGGFASQLPSCGLDAKNEVSRCSDAGAPCDRHFSRNKEIPWLVTHCLPLDSMLPDSGCAEHMRGLFQHHHGPQCIALFGRYDLVKLQGKIPAWKIADGSHAPSLTVETDPSQAPWTTPALHKIKFDPDPSKMSYLNLDNLHPTHDKDGEIVAHALLDPFMDILEPLLKAKGYDVTKMRTLGKKAIFDKGSRPEFAHQLFAFVNVTGHSETYPRYVIHLSRVDPRTWRNDLAAERTWQGTYDYLTPGRRGGFYTSADLIAVAHNLLIGPDDCLKNCVWLGEDNHLETSTHVKKQSKPMKRWLMLFEVKEPERAYSGQVLSTDKRPKQQKVFREQYYSDLTSVDAGTHDHVAPVSMIYSENNIWPLFSDWSEPLQVSDSRVVQTPVLLHNIATIEVSTDYYRAPTHGERSNMKTRAHQESAKEV
eukprot:TRINITY_DN40658_c0_g1_i1.p1 TRINITY_DN40658_c0_g1~~TRINITY_DN40658_c0_g1_i1.p1  ORF type:complete len:450 (-),score=17.33 TRINITY_DN40658_c0_g1_i1:262-1611(-)